MFKVNNRNTRTRCDICSKLKIMTSLWRRFIPCSNVSIVNFEQSNTGCEACTQNPITLNPQYTVLPLEDSVWILSRSFVEFFWFKDCPKTLDSVCS